MFQMSNADRPGSGSPRTIMFGVHSATHAASRSAKTSPGAAHAAQADSSSRMMGGDVTMAERAGTVRLPGGVPKDVAIAPTLAQQDGQQAAEAT